MGTIRFTNIEVTRPIVQIHGALLKTLAKHEVQRTIGVDISNKYLTSAPTKAEAACRVLRFRNIRRRAGA
jgi:hypothetical protein